MKIIVSYLGDRYRKPWEYKNKTNHIIPRLNEFIVFKGEDYIVTSVKHMEDKIEIRVELV